MTSKRAVEAAPGGAHSRRDDGDGGEGGSQAPRWAAGGSCCCRGQSSAEGAPTPKGCWRWGLAGGSCSHQRRLRRQRRRGLPRACRRQLLPRCARQPAAGAPNRRVQRRQCRAGRGGPAGGHRPKSGARPRAVEGPGPQPRHRPPASAPAGSEPTVLVGTCPGRGCAAGQPMRRAKPELLRATPHPRVLCQSRSRPAETRVRKAAVALPDCSSLP